MRHRAIRLYSLMPDWSALRRAVAILCAVAFLAVGFAHHLHHFGTSALTATSLSGTEPATGGLDTANDASGANDHCHGCTMLATLDEETAAATLIAAEIPLFRLNSGPAHRALVEPPPPKVTV